MTSDFWARKLGRQAPPPAAAPVAATAWWAPAQAPQQQAQQPVYQDELAGHDFSKAPSLRETDRCPDCGSGNYAAVAKATTRNGTVETRQCFECGYPVQHSTKGMGSTRGEAVDGRAKQVDSGGGIVHNYQPQNTAAGAIRSPRDL